MALSLMELVKQKRADLNRNSQRTVQPPEKKSRWRILPGWRKDDPTFYHDFGQHFIKDAAGAVKAVYVCVDKTYGKPCQVCDSLSHAIHATEDDAMVELLKQANANKRVLVNAIRVDEGDREPAVLALSPKTFDEFLKIIDEWGESVLSLDKGMDIVIERTGKGLQTKYSVTPGAKSEPVDPAVMKKITNLDEFVAQESEEQAKRALANLSAVTGMLPAPAAKKPTMADLSVEEVDETLDIPAESTRVADDAKVAVATATEAPAAPAAETKAPAADTSELDDLLAELG